MCSFSYAYSYSNISFPILPHVTLLACSQTSIYPYHTSLESVAQYVNPHKNSIENMWHLRFSDGCWWFKSYVIWCSADWCTVTNNLNQLLGSNAHGSRSNVSCYTFVKSVEVLVQIQDILPSVTVTKKKLIFYILFLNIHQCVWGAKTWWQQTVLFGSK